MLFPGICHVIISPNRVVLILGLEQPHRGVSVLQEPFTTKTQEGCGGLGGEDPGVFPKAGPIFQPPFSVLESAETLAGIACRAAGESGKISPAASNSCWKTVPARNFSALPFPFFLGFPFFCSL